LKALSVIEQHHADRKALLETGLKNHAIQSPWMCRRSIRKASLISFKFCDHQIKEQLGPKISLDELLAKHQSQSRGTIRSGNMLQKLGAL
jgi:hypothetical protein